MDINIIKKFIQLVKANQLTEFELEEEGFRIAIKRRNGGEPQVLVPATTSSPIVMAGSASAANSAVVSAAEAAEAKAKMESEKYVEIKSPMVGTFYRAPAPDAEAFVTLGQQVDKDSVVCIIEAMKVMNEIKAEVRGIVKKILVENANPVQFGQALFQIEPN